MESILPLHRHLQLLVVHSACQGDQRKFQRQSTKVRTGVKYLRATSRSQFAASRMERAMGSGAPVRLWN